MSIVQIFIIYFRIVLTLDCGSKKQWMDGGSNTGTHNQWEGT